MPGSRSDTLASKEAEADTSSKPALGASKRDLAPVARLGPDELDRRIAGLTRENKRLTEAVAARDAFLAFAAHELRNPMTPIVGRVELLRRMIGTASDEKIAHSIEHIEWLIARFMTRATTLLDVSRVNSGMLKLDAVAVDICELARMVGSNLRLLAERARSEISLDLTDTSIEVVGDPLAIEQILENLVSNAIKYGGGSPILISAAADPEKGIACISVRDGGPGISPESQARIFQRFERAVRPKSQVGGFGVGLWIVKQLSEAMNGTIEVTSAPGAGSTFCITLPLDQAKDTE